MGCLLHCFLGGNFWKLDRLPSCATSPSLSYFMVLRGIWLEHFKEMKKKQKREEPSPVVRLKAWIDWRSLYFVVGLSKKRDIRWKILSYLHFLMHFWCSTHTRKWVPTRTSRSLAIVKLQSSQVEELHFLFILFLINVNCAGINYTQLETTLLGYHCNVTDSQVFFWVNLLESIWQQGLEMHWVEFTRSQQLKAPKFHWY